MKIKLSILILLLAALVSAQSPGIATVTVSSGATPTLTTTAGVTAFVWTLTGNVTSSTFSSAAVGAGMLKLCEDGTGGRTVVLPTNFVGFQAMASTAANYCQQYTWYYDGTNVVSTGVVMGNFIPQNSRSAAYTTTILDALGHIYHPSADTTARTFTIDSNANVPYPIGTAITFVNDVSAGTVTIAITSDTLVLAGAGTTGSRTLAAGGMATAIKVTATRWMISGPGLT